MNTRATLNKNFTERHFSTPTQNDESTKNLFYLRAKLDWKKGDFSIFWDKTAIKELGIEKKIKKKKKDISFPHFFLQNKERDLKAKKSSYTSLQMFLN
jgi:hypothetical protein